MRDRSDSERPTLLVLASTYPRWQGDHEPGFVHELARRLTDRFNVVAVVPSAPGAKPTEAMDGVEVIRYRYAPRRFETLINDGGIVTNLRRHRWKALLVPLLLVAQALCTWRLLRTRRIDGVHAHWLIPQGLIVAMLGRWSRRCPPYLVTAHGADLFALRGRYLNALKRFVVRRAAMTTVVSGMMRESLVKLGAAAERISVLPMGVDLSERFTPDPTLKRSRDEILFVGRLVEKKGLCHLIDAMPDIVAKHPAAFLTVAGFGPEEQERREQVERLGLQEKIHFLGSLSQLQLPALYRRAAVFVAPFVQASSGDQEGLGLVMVEAAGCGCPVIASDLQAVRDVFDPSQATLVAPGSPAAISKAVCNALEKPEEHEQRALQTRDMVRAKFDWTLVADNYMKILGEIAQRRGHAAGQR